jgi:hypothetical protein
LTLARVVGPKDVAAALAVRVMTNTALTGATYDIATSRPAARRPEADHTMEESDHAF